MQVVGVMKSRASSETNTDPIEQRIAAGLTKLSLAIKHEAWRDAEKQGISPTQGQILTLLAAGRSERPTDIAENMGISLATVSASIKALVDKGLVAKRRVAEDGRGSRLVLTASGKREAELVAGWPDFLMEAVRALSPDEQAVFLKAIIKMIHTLQQQKLIPVARMCVHCRYFEPHAHYSGPKHHCHLVDARLDSNDLRIDCPEQEPRELETIAQTWINFIRKP